LASALAARLAARYDVDFLTTCSRSFLSDWGHDFFAPGKERAGAFDVHRFRVDDRSPERFNELNAALLAIPRNDLRAQTARIDVPSQATFLAENINSDELVAYIERERRRYRAFIFLPYLYGTTLRGIAVAGDRAYLQPCLHDEVYAYLRPVQRAVHLARGLLFNSPGEAALAARIYGPGIVHKSHVVGSGVEILHAPEAGVSLPNRVERGRYILCLGRRDATKGVDLLVEAFSRARIRIHDLTLVLAGPGDRTYDDPERHVVDLGFVSDDQRASLLAGAMALAVPSANESFSRVMMEAWAYRRPVIVNGQCDATRDAVEASDGGWIATSEAAWAQTLADVALLSVDERAAVAVRGRDYALRTADWDAVVARYADLFEERPARKPRGQGTVHQVLETLEFGDAISNHALALRDRLRARGYRSDILVRTVGMLVIDQARVFETQTLRNADAIVYHHSTGSAMTQGVVDARVPTAMIYHNITPGSFFVRYRPELAVKLEEGRAQLARLRDDFEVSLGDSRFNADELAALGFKNVDVLPICLDFRRFDTVPDAAVAGRLADGRQNILFVGRFAPNKAHADLIGVLARLRASGSNVRLILAGRYDGNEAYFAELRARADQLGVFDDVIFTGLITDAELLAYYQGSHVFLSLSDHEGFCVPLVEAMWFDLPIVAFGSSAVAETMGNAGIVLLDKNDHEAIGALIRIVIGDEVLRNAVVATQRTRRDDFQVEKTLAIFDRIIDKLLSRAPVS
jgi:glycosyltransferase involved in cell wall biosynthesis